MAIDVTAIATCDMCGRTETLTLRESWRAGRLDTDVPSLARSLPHWELLDKSGYPIMDARMGDGKLLCEPCARVYRETLKRQRDELDSLFA